MKYGIESLSKGAEALTRSLGMGQQMALEAQQAAQLNENKLAYTGARARKTDNEAKILADTLAARGDLGGSLAVLAGQLGLDDGSGEALAGAFRSSGGKADNLAKMMAEIAASARLNQAVDESDPTRSNKLLLAGGEQAYTPFSQTAGGLAIDEGTGRQIQSSPAARATVGKIGAEAGAAAALGRERDAGATANTALAALREVMQGTERSKATAADAQARERDASASSHTAEAGNREAEAARRALETDNLRAALAETDRGRANFLLRAAGESPYTPFEQTAGGLVLDSGTGATDQTSPAAQATIGETMADTAKTEAEKSVLNAELENLRKGLSKAGKPHDPVRGGPGGTGAGTLKAADSNSVYSKAAALFGGIYDPMTGNFQGLDENKAAKAIAIAARAAELLATDPTNNHSMAVSKAAQEYQIDIPSPLNIEPAAPGVSPGAALPQTPDTSIMKQMIGWATGGDAAPTPAPSSAGVQAPTTAVSGGESGTIDDPVSVSSPEQAEWLPPGTYFRNPAGQLMRVPVAQ